MTKTKILLIEDDPDQILMYQNKLELSGFSFISADNSEDGLALASSEKPDLILLDLLLKELTVPTGLEVLAKLKNDEKTKNIPVVILTNLGTRAAREKSFQLGADDFLVKSQVGLNLLVKKIKEILK